MIKITEQVTYTLSGLEIEEIRLLKLALANLIDTMDRGDENRDMCQSMIEGLEAVED